MTKEIKINMILQAIGKPKDYLKKALEEHVSKIELVNDVKVLTKNVFEAREIEEKKDIYSCFAEVEILVPSFQRVLELIFDFMPSSIEIIEPGKIEMDSYEATTFANNLAGRLHRYDEIAKLAQFKIRELSNQLAFFQENKEKIEKENKKKKKSKKS